METTSALVKMPDKLKISDLYLYWPSPEKIVAETQSHVGLTWNKVYSVANKWVDTTNYKSYILKNIPESSQNFHWITTSAWFPNKNLTFCYITKWLLHPAPRFLASLIGMQACFFSTCCDHEMSIINWNVYWFIPFALHPMTSLQELK